MSEVIMSRLDELIGEYDTPFFNYLIYSYDLTLEDCELIISKIRKDISDERISGDDNLVSVVQNYFTDKIRENERIEKLEYLSELMDENGDFYSRFLSGYDVSPRDVNIIYGKLETKITEENITDYQIRRDLEYYFSNAVRQGSYIASLKKIVGDYDTLMIKKIQRDYPNIHLNDLFTITNDLYSEILEGINFPNGIKTAFLRKVMNRSETKKADAIKKWEKLVLGNGDSFSQLLESKNLTAEDGEAIKTDIRARILDGLLCADRIDGVFLTKICINYSESK